MANNNLKELIKKRGEAEKALKAAQGKIIELTGRGDQLAKEIRGIADSKQKAEQAKKQALDKFVIGEISQSELDIIKKKLQEITQTEAELQELLEATKRARESLTKAIPNFNDALSVANRAIWDSIYETIKLDIQTAVGDLWVKAYASKNEAGGGSYEGIMRDILGQMPAYDIVQDLKGQVAKEYGLNYFEK
jgi:DNA repair exonuclease SbcCD ATPase subunit